MLGIALMLSLDGLLPHLHNGAAQAEGLPSSFRRTTLLVLAVTLHNIPEGMAVGLTFARAAQHSGDTGLLAAAGALALGIGIQNFPEGAAVSLPLREEGLSRRPHPAPGRAPCAASPRSRRPGARRSAPATASGEPRARGGGRACPAEPEGGPGRAAPLTPAPRGTTTQP